MLSPPPAPPIPPTPKQKERKQAALEKQRQSAERLGLRPATSTRSSDPLLNALGVDDL